ncbi:signal peptidase II [Syntrophothermus sp.]|uniref:signal peptidase II n=1 Tax=Syntrophothermus sp. TaxID=2736299 RepID=UPI002579D4F6|nr:signal peptidase II [Syntrophothermus sp.]
MGAGWLRRGGKKLHYWIIMLTVAGLDQLTKLWIQEYMGLGQSVPVIGNVLHVTRVLNQGGAFGLLSGRYFLFLATAIGLIFVVSYYAVYYKPNKALQFGLGLVSGGALGNLVDRLWHGGVVDFIDLGFWPVFNLADSAIVVGTAWLALLLLKSRG